MPNIAAFQKKYGADPHDVANDDDRWVRLRAEPQTLFMRGVRQLVNKQLKRVPIAVMVGHPWHYRGLQDPIDGNLRGLLLDVTTWANEGLMDAAIPAGYYRAGGNATKAFEALRAETNGKVDLWYYAWVPNTPEDFTHDFNAAQGLGANECSSGKPTISTIAAMPPPSSKPCQQKPNGRCKQKKTRRLGDERDRLAQPSLLPPSSCLLA